MHYRQQQILKPRKWLRGRHWPDNRGSKYAAPCRAQSHATGTIAPMSTPVGDSGKAGLLRVPHAVFDHVDSKTWCQRLAGDKMLQEIH